MQDFALQYWRFQGAPAKKLLMGFATYGRSFILASSQNGVGSPANNFASPGPYTQEMGMWSYFEVNGNIISGQKLTACKCLSVISSKGIFSFFKICLFLNGGMVQWLEDQKVPFSVKGSDWVGFDNLRSFEIKVNFN